jgi:hypothetical protein
MNVYIVVQGSYSDFHIEAVFTDKVKAEWYLTLLNNEYGGTQDAASLEEWEADVLPEASWYKISMKKDGSLVEAVPVSHVARAVVGFKYTPDGHALHMVTYVKTDDEKRAIKVANERRAQLIATYKWKDMAGSQKVLINGEMRLVP